MHPRRASSSTFAKSVPSLRLHQIIPRGCKNAICVAVTPPGAPERTGERNGGELGSEEGAGGMREVIEIEEIDGHVVLRRFR